MEFYVTRTHKQEPQPKLKPRQVKRQKLQQLSLTPRQQEQPETLPDRPTYKPMG